MGYCTSCGAQLQDEDYCTSCGARVTPTVVSNPAGLPPDGWQTAPQALGSASNGGGGGLRPWMLIAAIACAALLAVAGLVMMTRGGGGAASAPAANSTSGAPVTEPSPSVKTVTETATPSPASTAPTARKPSGTASSFVEGLYRDWSARDEANIAAKVSPAYVSAFPSSLLDGQGITGVDSYNNVESYQSGNTRVCGNQRFVKSNGLSQVEYRCFLVTDSNGAWRIIWTGDSATLQRWS